jgi:cytochrome P450
VTDLRALRFVFTGADAFHKPPAVRELLAHMLGRGVLVAEGAAHRAQRRALVPAFAPAQLRRLTGVFLDKANEVCPMTHPRVRPNMRCSW